MTDSPARAPETRTQLGSVCAALDAVEVCPQDRSGTIALVPARYGEELVGGAEIVLAEMAQDLKRRGWDVEILTTCALNHHTWENVLPAGTNQENGLTVRRFPAVMEPFAERGEIEVRILAGAAVTITEQQRWMNAGMRVPELYHYLAGNASRYRAIVFTPYPFWVTFAGSQVVPGKSVLWTCLHDEPYAYLELFQPVFTGVAGLLFQSGPEHDLAHELTPFLSPHAEVGCPVGIPSTYDAEGFRERYGIQGRFLLYAGRREGAKGWEDLLDSLAMAAERGSLPFQLVTMGSGDINAPESLRDRIVDLGFLPDDERDNAFAAADAYIQPSKYEAFSRTIMEAWLAGTPVIANAASAVVKWHCERSGAGLVYSDAFELEQCLKFVAENPKDAVRMAESGRDYVINNYRPEDVFGRVEAAIVNWTSA